MAARSITGLDKNTAGALSYVLFFVSGVVFLVMENDKYVRFHALQSVVVFGTLAVLFWLFGLVSFLNFLSGLLSIFGFSLYLLLIYKAWSGEEWEVPVFGRLTTKIVGKL